MPTYTVPSPGRDAWKSWRKTVTGVDLTATRGYAIQGEFLDAGAAYALPVGVLVLGVEQARDGTTVTLWTTGDGALGRVRRLTRKGPWAGKATINIIAKALATHPWPAGARAVKTAHARNVAAGDCLRCRRRVAAGDGIQAHDARGRVVVQHDPCPPLRNEYPGRCGRCGGWVDAREGVLVRRRDHVMYLRAEMLLPPLTGEQYLELTGLVVLHRACPATRAEPRLGVIA